MGRYLVQQRPLVALVLACVGCFACTSWAPADTYEYSDDFSTDLVEVDSYSHSTIHDVMPEIWIEAFLIYDWVMLDRVLAFYGGFDPLIYALLRYRFPLGEVPHLITECDIEFTLVECTMPFYVDVSADGASWSQVAETGLPGVYSVHLDYRDPLDGWLYIRFRSEGTALTSFSVSMECTTPVEQSTWGAVKALYR